MPFGKKKEEMSAEDIINQLGGSGGGIGNSGREPLFGGWKSNPIVWILAVIIALIACIACYHLYHETVKVNNDQNYQIVQTIGGDVWVRDQPGYYCSPFATVTTYPRIQEAFFSASVKEGGTEDDSIGVTFNDGGTAKISTFVRYRLPIDMQKRRDLHRAFSANPENIKASVRAALINVVKATAPVMTATENQSSRKAEFTDLIQRQLQEGLYSYEMKVEENIRAVANDGKPVKVYRSEIMRDTKGKPIISQKSPLEEYGIEIIQFAVTEIDYDKPTLAQFEAKKTSFLNAESFKAQKDTADQEALMIKATGLKDAAKQEAASNVIATQARITAQMKVTVAEQEKLQAETVASQKVAVAEQQKLEATVLANQEKEVAEIAAQKQLAVSKLRLEAAKAEAEAIETLATATAKQISMAGMITEKEKTLAEIARSRDIGVAEALAHLQVPSTVINGGSGTNGNSTDMSSTLMNLTLLKSMGVLKDSTAASPAVSK